MCIKLTTHGHLFVLLFYSGSPSSSRVVLVAVLVSKPPSLPPNPGSFNLIQLAIAKTLLICPFGHLYVYKILEIFISILLALQVVAIEVVVAV